MTTFRRAIKRLRLKPGDILLADRELRIDQIMGAAKDIKFEVPIIFIRFKNELERMPFEQIERIYLAAKKSKEGK